MSSGLTALRRMCTLRLMSDTRRIVVRLSGDELRALATVRAKVQAIDPGRAVTDAGVLRECMLEQAGRYGWERKAGDE